MSDLKITPARRALLWELAENGRSLVRGGSVLNYLLEHELVFCAGMVETLRTVYGRSEWRQTYDITLEGQRVLGIAPAREEAPEPEEGDPVSFLERPPNCPPWAPKVPHIQVGNVVVTPLMGVLGQVGWNLYKDGEPICISPSPVSPWLFFDDEAEAVTAAKEHA